MKVGDTLVCIKSLGEHYNVEAIENFIMYNEYKIVHIYEDITTPYVSVKGEKWHWAFSLLINNEESIFEHFITIKEYRKIKMETILK